MITTTIVSLRVALTLLALAIVAAMLSSCGGNALAPTPYTVASRCAVDPHACATPPKCITVAVPVVVKGSGPGIQYKAVCEGDPDYPTGGTSHEGQ